MIKIVKSKDTITIYGHANYADYGKDIVCASVSSIIYTSVNGILNLDSNAIEFIDNNDQMIIKVLNHDNVTIKLINNMLNLITELSKEYPNKIKISKGE